MDLWRARPENRAPWNGAAIRSSSPTIPRSSISTGSTPSVRAEVGEREQLGFARAITDRATFAYLADVFVVESERGRGLGQWLVECVRAHPDLAGVRRFVLVTRDAHALYERCGWRALAKPERYMEIVRENAYAGPPAS